MDLKNKIPKYVPKASKARVQEIQFNNAEANIIINAKLLLDINKIIEDIKMNLKRLEQDIKNKLLE